MKPYYTYRVTGNPLPEGYSLEQSEVAPVFGQPGGGTQFRILGPKDQEVNVQKLINEGFLERVGPGKGVAGIPKGEALP